VIIKGDRATIKSSRYFHGDDDFRIPAGYADWLELEFVFLDCCDNPCFNGFFPLKRFSLIMDERIIRKARKNGIISIGRGACLFTICHSCGIIPRNDWPVS